MSFHPPLDARDDKAVAATLRADTPAYTPEWHAHPGSAADAVLQTYAHYRGLLNQGLNQVPQAQQAACLDMLGAQLLPAQGARVPLVFTVAPESGRDITLAQGSQVAAQQPAPLPSLEPLAKAAPAGAAPVFATERTVTLTPGRLLSLTSLDAGSDRFADHSAHLGTGFELFSAMQLTPHELYLGHDTLFALGGDDITLIVGLQLKQASSHALAIAWEYLADSGWLPLPHALEEDSTSGLTRSGQVTLRRVCGPNAKKATMAGRESFWIRARLTSALISALIGGLSAALPVVNDIRVRVKFRKQNLLPEAAFADVVALDLSKNFYPFGLRPDAHACFYLASKEVFARPRARVRLNFEVSSAGVGSTAELAWEYLSDLGWRTLIPTPPNGGTSSKSFPFTGDAAGGTGTAPYTASIGFACPTDWAEAEVNGVKNRWLRVRLTAGNFGTPAVYDATATPPYTPETFQPPVLGSIKLEFEYLTDPEPVQHGLTYNDFAYADITEAALWPDKTFVPFTPVQDQVAAIHFGFERALPDGMGSLFVHCPTEGAGAGSPSPWQWEYRAADGWRELSVIDETAGFQRSGMIQFIGPRDATATDGLHGKLYRLRARLKPGEAFAPLPVSGVWLNAVWAQHQSSCERELLGRSDGHPNQRMALAHTPVHSGEQVEVEEWVGRGDTWRLALADVAAADLRIERDPVSGEALAAWVRWAARAHLHDAGPGDRIYALERASGSLRFGSHVPLAGRRVVASYRSGGGLSGNVPAHSVTQLRLAQPLITAATNPVPAAAGADAEPLARALCRGPQALRHRQRALSAQDIEWLAREASPEVARVRCLPLQGPDGHAQRGCYTVLVAPYSTEPQPAPAQALARKVHGFLAQHAPATARLRVLGPRYLSVAVRAVIVPQAADDAALVEERVRAALQRFLHPILGGVHGEGWQFGEAVPLSRLATLLEGLPGVSHAQGLVLLADGALCADAAAPARDALPSAGLHELILKIGGGA